MAQLDSGDVVDSRFEVEFCAGAGGMGRIYRCRDATTGHSVALKVINAATGASRERFAREVRVLSELRHPGIVRYVAHGILSDSEPYLVMEWVSGEPLAGRVCAEPLSVSEAISLGRRLCDALSEAHARQIVHRDIKPSNIILENGNLACPKILDFGLARGIDASHAITKTGGIVGTPAYMAPEQARRSGEIDARVDVFALGCVLFECLAGYAAFRGPNVVSILCKVLLEDPPWLSDLRSDVPAQLSALIARMLAKEPESRPRDARAVGEALEGLSDVPQRDSNRPPRPSLGAEEQRYISVILAGRPQGEALGESEGTQGAPPVRLSRALAPFKPEINVLIDSTVMLTLRGQGAASDRAAHAARCALAVRDIMPRLPVVLATGRGMVRGRKTVGEVIDEAARLLSVAAQAAPSETDGGLVLVDAVSASLLDARFDLRRRDEHAELLSYRTQSGEPRTLLGRETPCVGRARELASLRALWEECVEESVARPVLITGVPGIGKTRLIREWLSELKTQHKTTSVLSARADPMALGGAFGMLGRLVASAAGIRDDDPPDTVAAKIRARVEAQVAPEEAARVAEFLAEMVGVSQPDSESLPQRAARHDVVLRGDQIRRAFRDWLAAECKAHPVVIVLEDLQWGDLPTVELLGSLLGSLRDAPLCVVGLARPEIEERFPRLWSERNITSFSLGPLRFRAAVQLVCAVLDGIPDARAEIIARRSGGNPFFLEELIRAEAKGVTERVPATVLATLQARLDEFSPSLRLVLRAASVLGDTFSPQAVAVLLGADEGEVLRSLDALLEREILVRAEEPAPRAYDLDYPHATLSFAQGLWREAAYATLTDRDRCLGHALAAGWLEENRPSEAFAIAEHYVLGNLPERAARWFCVAARHALEAADYGAALERAERGLACGVRSVVGELRCVQAEAHKWRGENVAAELRAREAMAELAPGEVAWYTAAGELAAAAGKLGHGDALVALADTLQAAHPVNLDAEAARVIAMSRAATQLVLAGRNDAADQLLASFAHGEADAAVVGFLYEARAVRAGAGHDPEARVSMAQRAAACFMESGDLRNASLQLGSVGFALNELGAYAEAERHLREAMALGARLSLANAVSTAEAQLGRALWRLGRAQEAEATLLRAAEALRAQANQRLEGVARGYLACLWLEQGRLDEAEQEARRALEVLAGAAPLWAAAGATLASVLLARGRPSEAREAAHKAVQVLEAKVALSTGEALVRLMEVETRIAVGERAAAARAAEAAYAFVSKRAGQLRKPELREAFARVREHVRILELHRALCAG